MSQSVCLIVKWRVQADHLDQVLTLLSEMGKKSRAETGNIMYEAHQSQEDPTVIWLYEVYEDESAVLAHKNSPHYQKIVAEQIMPYLKERELIRVNKLE